MQIEGRKFNSHNDSVIIQERFEHKKSRKKNMIENNLPSVSLCYI